ncbi:hypothetical protein PTKIN_Ptkin05aG0085500 [Pterospermum kingtungense]
MGGCASKPKESDNFPVEAAASPEKSQLETTTQDNANGGESQIEKPLVDLSEPEKEAQAGASSEPKAVAAEPFSLESKVAAETAKPTDQEDVKVAPKNVEDKDVEVTDNTTVPPAAKEAEAVKPTAAPAPSKEEVKTDAPLVSL